MIFLDTDVLIDCQRGLPAAAAWLRQNETTAFAIPGIVAMELVVGCRDKKDLRITQTFLKRFPVVWPNAPDTFNLKHYHAFSGLAVREPYLRD